MCSMLTIALRSDAVNPFQVLGVRVRVGANRIGRMGRIFTPFLTFP